jgi:hypothetical protein
MGVPKPHTISFSKWTTVKWYVGAADSKPFDLKIRTLYVDGRAKEFTAGPVHDITDHLFVVLRVFRVNDSLPQEQDAAPRWRWQRGGWLLVSRVTGHTSSFSLPEFDSYYSVASWYRDYVAYCGVSDEGDKINAMILQFGRRKPILKKALGELASGEMPDSVCSAPAWDREPTRVTFETTGNQKLTYTVRRHAADLVNDEEEEEEASK